MPHIRLLADHVHERGGFFTLHSCGNALTLIPAMKEAHIDSWQAQCDAIDLDAAMREINDAFIVETTPAIPEDFRADEAEPYLEGLLKRYTAADLRIFLEFADAGPEAFAGIRRSFYVCGRNRARELSLHSRR